MFLVNVLRKLVVASFFLICSSFCGFHTSSTADWKSTEIKMDAININISFPTAHLNVIDFAESPISGNPYRGYTSEYNGSRYALFVHNMKDSFLTTLEAFNYLKGLLNVFIIDYDGTKNIHDFKAEIHVSNGFVAQFPSSSIAA